MKTSNTASSISSSRSNGGAGQQAVAAEHDTADRSRDIANHTFDQLAHAVESARNTTVPAIEKLTIGAESMAHRGLELARATSQQMRTQAQLASERTAGFVRQEPVKSLMLAAAAGALLMMLFSSGKRDRH